MVKQGHYAKSSRKKMVRQFKQHHAQHEARAIDPLKIKDFLLVRYHLTQAKQQRVVVQKTMQQFFGNWLDLATAPENGQIWDVTALTKQTLQLSGYQVPWQYYAILNQQFSGWQDFLLKEVPAVPLEDRLSVIKPLTPTTWQASLSQQLAVNGLIGTWGREHLAQVTAEQVSQLQTSLVKDGHMDWAAVAAVCAPIQIDLASFDQGVQGLIRRLEKLSSDDFY